jgi:hypothetical protein
MYNSKPSTSDLPTSRQLVRSTVIALIAAGAILIVAVLPAEYAIDPTGIGRMLGLTEMGQIKDQLAEEAAADAANGATLAEAMPTDPVSNQTADDTEITPEAPAIANAWRDEMRVVLAPDQGAEIKLAMKAGQKASFTWVAEGGVVNFDMHGDGGGDAAISYEKGRGAATGDGVLEAAFDGNHGWYWRNRGATPVTVVVRASGEYLEMKRM